MLAGCAFADGSGKNDTTVITARSRQSHAETAATPADEEQLPFFTSTAQETTATAASQTAAETAVAAVSDAAAASTAETTVQTAAIPPETATATSETAAAAYTQAATAASTAETVKPAETAAYVCNSNSKKFHLPDCGAVKTIKAENRTDYRGLRAELIAEGYAPCKKCNP